jgi:hypothetical protein
MDAYIKNWRETNAEHISQYNKKWYAEHKEKMKASILLPVVCECGFHTAKCNLKRHQKSKNHIKKMGKI